MAIQQLDELNQTETVSGQAIEIINNPLKGNEKKQTLDINENKSSIVTDKNIDDSSKDDENNVVKIEIEESLNEAITKKLVSLDMNIDKNTADGDDDNEDTFPAPPEDIIRKISDKTKIKRRFSTFFNDANHADATSLDISTPSLFDDHQDVIEINSDKENRRIRYPGKRISRKKMSRKTFKKTITLQPCVIENENTQDDNIEIIVNRKESIKVNYRSDSYSRYTPYKTPCEENKEKDIEEQSRKEYNAKLLKYSLCAAVFLVVVMVISVVIVVVVKP